MLCASGSCKINSFICLDEKCENCSTSHEECEIYKLPKVISKLNKKKQKITPQIEDAIKAMETVYDEAIEKLSINK